MSIFLVTIVQTSGPEGTVGDAIKGSALPWLQVSDTAFLIAHNGTAKQISDDFGITDLKRGTGVVTEVASYYGREDPGVWTWLKANWAGANA